MSCYASDNIFQVSPARKVTLLAYDPQGTTLARPTNIAFGGSDQDDLYVANLGRWHINRAKVGIKGQPLVNQRASAIAGRIPSAGRVPVRQGPLDHCTDEMTTAYRRSFVRQVQYLPKAESAEHRRHGLRLNQIFDAADRQYAAGERVQSGMSH